MYSELAEYMNTLSLRTCHILTLSQDPSVSLFNAQGTPLAWLSVVCLMLIFRCAGYLVAFNEKPLASHIDGHWNIAMMKLHIGVLINTYVCVDSSLKHPGV